MAPTARARRSRDIVSSIRVDRLDAGFEEEWTKTAARGWLFLTCGGLRQVQAPGRGLGSRLNDRVRITVARCPLAWQSPTQRTVGEKWRDWMGSL